RPGRACALHGQPHPVAHRSVFHGGGAVDVAFGDRTLQQRVAVGGHHAHGPRSVDLERLVVRAVLLSLLRHETDVGDRTHGARVEGSVRLAVVYDDLIDTGVRAVRDHELGVVRFAVRPPHLAGVADRGR